MEHVGGSLGRYHETVDPGSPLRFARDDETFCHSRAGGNPPGPEQVEGLLGCCRQIVAPGSSQEYTLGWPGGRVLKRRWIHRY